MLNAKDYKEIQKTLATIDHVSDDQARKTNQEYTRLAKFILMRASELFYTQDGTPKSFVALLRKFMAIIRFVYEICAIITEDVRVKADKRDKRIARAANRVHRMIDTVGRHRDLFAEQERQERSKAFDAATDAVLNGDDEQQPVLDMRSDYTPISSHDTAIPDDIARN